MANLNSDKQRIILSYSNNTSYEDALKYIYDSKYNNVVFFQDKYRDIWKNGQLYASYTRNCAYTKYAYERAIDHIEARHAEALAYTETCYNKSIQYTDHVHDIITEETDNAIDKALSDYSSTAEFMTRSDEVINGVYENDTDATAAFSDTPNAHYINLGNTSYIKYGTGDNYTAVIRNRLYTVTGTDAKGYGFYYFVPKKINNIEDKWIKIAYQQHLPATVSCEYTENLKTEISNRIDAGSWNNIIDKTKEKSSIPTDPGIIVTITYDSNEIIYQYVVVKYLQAGDPSNYVMKDSHGMKDINTSSDYYIQHKIPYVNQYSEEFIGSKLIFNATGDSPKTTNSTNITTVMAQRHGKNVTLTLPSKTGTLVATSNDEGDVLFRTNSNIDKTNDTDMWSGSKPIIPSINTIGETNVGSSIKLHEIDEENPYTTLIENYDTDIPGNIQLTIPEKTDYNYDVNDTTYVGELITKKLVESKENELSTKITTLEDNVDTLSESVYNIYNAGVNPEAKQIYTTTTNKVSEGERIGFHTNPVDCAQKSNKTFTINNEDDIPLFKVLTDDADFIPNVSFPDTYKLSTSQNANTIDNYKYYEKIKVNNEVNSNISKSALYKGIYSNERLITNNEKTAIENSDYWTFTIDLPLGCFKNYGEYYVTNISMYMYDTVDNEYIDIQTCINKNGNNSTNNIDKLKINEDAAAPVTLYIKSLETNNLQTVDVSTFNYTPFETDNNNVITINSQYSKYSTSNIYGYLLDYAPNAANDLYYNISVYKPLDTNYNVYATTGNLNKNSSPTPGSGKQSYDLGLLFSTNFNELGEDLQLTASLHARKLNGETAWNKIIEQNHPIKFVISAHVYQVSDTSYSNAITTVANNGLFVRSNINSEDSENYLKFDTKNEGIELSWGGNKLRLDANNIWIKRLNTNVFAPINPYSTALFDVPNGGTGAYLKVKSNFISGVTDYYHLSTTANTDAKIDLRSNLVDEYCPDNNYNSYILDKYNVLIFHRISTGPDVIVKIGRGRYDGQHLIIKNTSNSKAKLCIRIYANLLGNGNALDDSDSFYGFKQISKASNTDESNSSAKYYEAKADYPVCMQLIWVAGISSDGSSSGTGAGAWMEICNWYVK